MPDIDLSALNALRRLRRAETDAARRDLAEALTREASLSVRQNALNQELQAARQFTGEFDREAFAAWLGRTQAERERLGSAVREAEAHTATVRTTLAHRRVAETSAEAALTDALAVQMAATQRREQVVLEDAARALRRMEGYSRCRIP